MHSFNITVCISEFNFLFSVDNSIKYKTAWIMIYCIFIVHVLYLLFGLHMIFSTLHLYDNQKNQIRFLQEDEINNIRRNMYNNFKKTILIIIFFQIILMIIYIVTYPILNKLCPITYGPNINRTVNFLNIVHNVMQYAFPIIVINSIFCGIFFQLYKIINTYFNKKQNINDVYVYI
jgi:hypothetical protein